MSLATSWMIALLTTDKILNKLRIKGLVYRTWTSVIFIGPGLLGFLGRCLHVYNVFELTLKSNPSSSLNASKWCHELWVFMAIFQYCNLANFHRNIARVLKDHEKWWSRSRSLDKVVISQSKHRIRRLVQKSTPLTWLTKSWGGILLYLSKMPAARFMLKFWERNNS